MKHVHKIVCCIVFFTTFSVLAKIAKTTSGAPTNIPATRSPQPANQPAVQQQPVAQVITYKQLRDKITSIAATSRSTVINPQTKLLGSAFVENMKNDVKKTGGLRNDQQFVLYTLLTTARDYFSIFASDDTQNMNYLQNINQQIKNAVDSL